jgi:hypothetical protein
MAVFQGGQKIGRVLSGASVIKKGRLNWRHRVEGHLCPLRCIGGVPSKYAIRSFASIIFAGLRIQPRLGLLRNSRPLL